MVISVLGARKLLPPEPLASVPVTRTIVSTWPWFELPWMKFGAAARTPAGTLYNRRMKRVPWLAPAQTPSDRQFEFGVKNPRSKIAAAGVVVAVPSVLKADAKPSDRRTVNVAKALPLPVDG